MPTSAPTSSQRVIPHKPKWHGRIAAHLIYWVTRLFTATIRFRLHPQRSNMEIFDAPGTPQPVIFCIWHNRLFLCLALYFLFAVKRQPTRRMAALVSASRDGGILSQVLELYHIQPVRGSSSRRGGQALIELHTWAGKGLDLAITPDGPRGPRYRIHPGAITMAQTTGLPILPICYHLSWKYTLKSWDGFQIPFPFCKCTISVGDPIYIPRQLTAEEREAWREKVNRAMLDQTDD